MVALPKFIFDLEGTLIDTSTLQDYRSTREGRDYITENIHWLPTEECQPGIIRLARTLHAKGQIGIITNASPDFARALVRKHGLTGIPLYPAAEKPSRKSIIAFLEKTSTLKRSALVIGDSCIDILAAHSAGISSVAVNWGLDTENQLQQAEPKRIVSTLEELTKAIENFQRDQLPYTPRLSLRNFLTPSDLNDKYIDFEHYFLEDYHPYNSGSKNDFTNKVLNLKKIKTITPKELSEGYQEKFFYNGRLNIGNNLHSVYTLFLDRLVDLIAEKAYSGDETLIIAAPNSLPAFCYKTDVNHMLTGDIGETLETPSEYGRLINRLIPKPEDHAGKRTTVREHLTTLGIPNNLDEITARTIIIFDDIYTSGTQSRSIINFLRERNIGHRYIVITLGKTV